MLTRPRAYRAEHNGKRQQYYIRSGDSSFVMSPPLLRTMFHPQLQAVFEVSLDFSWDYVKHNGDQAAIRCCCTVANRGSASARNLFIVVRSPIGQPRQRKYEPTVGWVRAGNVGDRVGFESGRPLHPDCEFAVFDLEWITPTTTAISDHQVIPQGPAPSFDFKFFAEHQASQAVTITVPEDECMVFRRTRSFSRTTRAE